MKQIAIFGSTGSIGKSTIDVAESFPKEFRVVCLTTNANIDVLSRQVRRLRPETVCVTDERAAGLAKARIKGCRVLIGREGLSQICGSKSIDTIVMAIAGSAALMPLLSAIEAGKDIALANKEALVMAGPLIKEKIRKHKARLFPVDSEQSAIWQCLKDEPLQRVNTVYLTASGGPFRLTAQSAFKKITLRQVLRHPRWKMGRKITVDSATMANKGLEVLEAMTLFDLPLEKIKVLIHPEAIIHSMVEFIDGVVMAQLSVTDMRIPIQYALSYPERLVSHFGKIDFCALRALHFEAPDYRKFPCLSLAYEAAKRGETFPCVFNQANEMCVDAFLKGRIRFMDIARVIGKVITRHSGTKRFTLFDIFAASAWARAQAQEVIYRLT